MRFLTTNSTFRLSGIVATGLVALLEFACSGSDTSTPLGSTGGAAASTGGAATTGGASPVGGSASVGGNTGVGGKTSIGGSPATGGTTAASSTGGAQATGGVAATEVQYLAPRAETQRQVAAKPPAVPRPTPRVGRRPQLEARKRQVASPQRLAPLLLVGRRRRAGHRLPVAARPRVVSPPQAVRPQPARLYLRTAITKWRISTAASWQ